MVSQAQIKAQEKYDKQNTSQITLKLNNVSDADILEKLQGTPNKQGYIKELVRQDMRNSDGILSFDAIRCLLLPVIKKYHITSLSVFGSYARNEAKPSSDVDILIDGDINIGMFEYIEMLNAMKFALGKDVDVIMQNTFSRNNSRADILFREKVEREKVVLI